MSTTEAVHPLSRYGTPVRLTGALAVLALGLSACGGTPPRASPRRQKLPRA
ncbi:hypothetical protein [Nesterenkonia pannonica]|uniref:hypothetical protein n=1 Tax=Nesterenkonia pannonica TaxID=1548602 RepID=UPI0021644C8B|nr:hypothetical protein [Nesterenkonia pannonica]